MQRFISLVLGLTAVALFPLAADAQVVVPGPIIPEPVIPRPVVPAPVIPEPWTGARPPFEIIDAARLSGFEPVGRPMLHGRFYVLRAIDPYDRGVRVMIDADTARIISASPDNAGAGTVGMAAPPTGYRYGPYQPVTPPGSRQDSLRQDGARQASLPPPPAQPGVTPRAGEKRSAAIPMPRPRKTPPAPTAPASPNAAIPPADAPVPAAPAKPGAAAPETTAAVTSAPPAGNMPASAASTSAKPGSDTSPAPQTAAPQETKPAELPMPPVMPLE